MMGRIVRLAGLGLFLALAVAAIVFSFTVRSAPEDPVAGVKDALKAENTSQGSPFLPPPAPSGAVAAQPGPYRSSTDIERRATLKEIGRALAGYYREHEKYPENLTILSRAGLLGRLVLDSSYDYRVAQKDPDAYSLCTTLSDGTYVCLSSSVSDEILFTLPKDSMDPRSVSLANGQTWTVASSTETLAVPFPPDWTRSYIGGGYGFDLLGQKETGGTAIIARFTLVAVAYDPAQNLNDFTKNLIASYGTDMQVTGTIDGGTRKGVAVHEVTGINRQGDQEYVFAQLLLRRSSTVQIESFFVDKGMGARFTPLLQRIFDLTNIAQ